MQVRVFERYIPLQTRKTPHNTLLKIFEGTLRVLPLTTIQMHS